MKAKKVFEQILRHPAPMRRLDDYLLKHYPQVWRLRVHYVLVYWLLAALTLFVAGYSMPLDFYRSINDSKFYDVSQLVLGISTALVGLLSFFTWRNKLSGIQQKSAYRWYVTLSEILLYALCIFVILLSVFAFTFGFKLKSSKVRCEATAIFHSDLFRAHDYFYPAYIPHFDSTKNELSDAYFRRGEQLFGILLQRYLQPRDTSYWELSPEASVGRKKFASRLEAETMTFKGHHFTVAAAAEAWDSIRLWGYMPYGLRNDFEQHLPLMPYLLGGLSFEEDLRFLEQSRDTFTLTDADMIQIQRHYRDLERTHFEDNTPASGQAYRYFYEPGIRYSAKKFYYKCLLESLDSAERKVYHDYLLGLQKIEILHLEDALYEMVQMDSTMKNRLLLYLSNSEMEQYGIIKQGLKFLDSYVSRLDSASINWYKEYTFTKSGVKYPDYYDDEYLFRELLNSTSYYYELVKQYYPRPGDTADAEWVRQHTAFANRIKPWSDQLRAKHPKVTDSLLFFYPNQTQLYLEDVSTFFYDRYLDYYFRKHNTTALDTLRERLVELGYRNPEDWNRMDDNVRKVLLSDAISFFRDAISFFRTQEDLFGSNDEAFSLIFWPTLVIVATYLAVLFFFFCNTDLVVMMRSFFVIIILFAVAALFLNIVSGRILPSSLILRGISLFFISGVPAIATIVLLTVLRYRMALLALLSQVQIILSFTVIVVIDPIQALDLPRDHFAYHHCSLYLLAYWCVLLITIAILYRRHQILPEKA